MKFGYTTQTGGYDQAQYQVTEVFKLLHHLFLNNTKDSGMAELLESVLNQILKAQVTEQLEAEYYERTNDRKGYRNGTYLHTLSTRELCREEFSKSTVFENS